MARKTGLTSDYSTLHPTPERPVPPPAAHFFLVHNSQLTVLSQTGGNRTRYGSVGDEPFASDSPIHSGAGTTTVRGSRGDKPSTKLERVAGPERAGEMKKGAGASPLFVIDAPKPVTESRIGSGHPGKPIFYVNNQRANRMPAAIVPREAADLIETMAVSFKSGQKGSMLHCESIQNPTERRQGSPFFGSALRRFCVDRPAIGCMGDHELKIESGGREKNIVIAE